MHLDLENKLANDIENKKLVEDFIKDLQEFLNNCLIKIEKEDISLIDPIHNDKKIITEYRDKMLLERAQILSNYAKQTSDRGLMYYIYDKNSKMEDGYNLCVCEEGKSHTILEVSKEDLPNGSEIGSVLRKNKDGFSLDEEATEEISQELYNMKNELLKEQTEFLESKRIEEHIYEMSEKDEDRAWLFDLTNSSDEAVEEINFPKELLKDSKEGDLFIYRNGEYQKY